MGRTGIMLDIKRGFGLLGGLVWQVSRGETAPGHVIGEMAWVSRHLTRLADPDP